jgi:hypothetical protein
MTASVPRGRTAGLPVFLAPYLWAYMRLRGWGWRELACYLGVSPATLWELGLCRRPASPAAVEELCRRWGALPHRLAEVLASPLPDEPAPAPPQPRGEA